MKFSQFHSFPHFFSLDFLFWEVFHMTQRNLMSAENNDHYEELLVRIWETNNQDQKRNSAYESES